MLSLPNLLTLSRIFTVPILVALLWYPGWELGYGLGFGLYCLMGITDYFDGYLARAQGTVSKLGVFLVPIADKIMVAAVIVMLVGTRHEAASITGLHPVSYTHLERARGRRPRRSRRDDGERRRPPLSAVRSGALGPGAGGPRAGAASRCTSG